MADRAETTNTENRGRQRLFFSSGAPPSPQIHAPSPSPLLGPPVSPPHFPKISMDNRHLVNRANQVRETGGLHSIAALPPIPSRYPQAAHPTLVDTLSRAIPPSSPFSPHFLAPPTCMRSAYPSCSSPGPQLPPPVPSPLAPEILHVTPSRYRIVIPSDISRMGRIPPAALWRHGRMSDSVRRCSHCRGTQAAGRQAATPYSR